VPKGEERLVMGAKIRNNYRGFVDSPYKIYCGNLGWGVNSQGLREAFAEQPGILSAKVVYEKDSGRSRGFGFVSFTTAESAAAALDNMNGVVRTFLVHQFCNFKFILWYQSYYISTFLLNVMMCFSGSSRSPIAVEYGWRKDTTISFGNWGKCKKHCWKLGIGLKCKNIRKFSRSKFCPQNARYVASSWEVSLGIH